jgi:hypothetical protein
MPGTESLATQAGDTHKVNAGRKRLNLMVAEIGPIAAEAIEVSCEGRVSAVFARSAYLDLGSTMVCVGVPGIRRGPLNARVDSRSAVCEWLARIAPGEAVTGTPRRLRTGGMQLEFEHARRWHPPRAALPVDRGRVARGVAQLRAVAAGRIPREGLAFLVAGGPSSNRLAPAGHAAANALSQWLAGGMPDVASETVHALSQLIGLGPGLTPSGDDFLGGALIALHALGSQPLAQALAAKLLPLCEHRTHPISVAHIRAAAAGVGGEALHACLCTMVDARDPGACLEAIASTGHTSGWDALAGAVTVAAGL